MSWETYEIRVPAKWVLAGEHAVIRGATAIALPLREFGFQLSFIPKAEGGLEVIPIEHAVMVRELVENALRIRGVSGAEMPRGKLQLSSTIPVGAGLGSSAALCVAIVRWLAQSLDWSAEEVRQTATELEHRFHGRSSGMDVAALLAGGPIAYSVNSGSVSLDVANLPRFTFHDTGLRAATRDCVETVRGLFARNLRLAESLDRRMAEAAELARQGLIEFERGQEEEGLRQLSHSLELSQSCFEAWGLVPEEAASQIRELRAQGALGVKLTGAGRGGMLVALWANDLSAAPGKHRSEDPSAPL